MTARCWPFTTCVTAVDATFRGIWIISDNMMLQRNKPARVWGKGDEGKAVKVTFKAQNNPIVNLFGKNGLPVGPFRTDTFKLNPS